MNLWLAAAWYAARCGRGNGSWKGGLGRRHPLAPAALSVAFGHSRSEGAAHGTFSSQLGQFTDAVASLNCAIVAVSPWTEAIFSADSVPGPLRANARGIRSHTMFVHAERLLRSDR